MKLIAAIALFMLVIQGCSLQSRLDKYCPLCVAMAENSDSCSVKRDSTEKRDTVWRQSPADSATIKALAECRNGKAYMPETVVTSGRSTITVSIDANVVKATAECKADSFMMLYIFQKVSYSEFRNRVKTIIPKPVVTENYANSFFYWWFGCTLAMLLGLVVRKIIKLYTLRK